MVNERGATFLEYIILIGTFGGLAFLCFILVLEKHNANVKMQTAVIKVIDTDYKEESSCEKSGCTTSYYCDVLGQSTATNKENIYRFNKEGKLEARAFCDAFAKENKYEIKFKKFKNKDRLYIYDYYKL